MPSFYTKPRVGQAMRLRTSPDTHTDGFVSAVDVRAGNVTRKDGSVTENWTAEITSAFSSTARITYATEMTDSSWLPVPAGEYDLVYGEGYALLREEIQEALSSRTDGSEDLRPLLEDALRALASLADRVSDLENSGLSEAVARHDAVLAKLASTPIAPATVPAPLVGTPPTPTTVPQRRR